MLGISNSSVTRNRSRNNSGVLLYVATESQHTEPALPRMTTIYIGKGKKDKISKGDIVGFLCKAGGLTSDMIGRIDVKDRYTYAAIKREKLKQVLHQTRGEKIKGIKTIVEQWDNCKAELTKCKEKYIFYLIYAQIFAQFK